ncbi:hypothetical protein PCE1_004746 [Barthelona sp. PCE]
MDLSTFPVKKTIKIGRSCYFLEFEGTFKQCTLNISEVSEAFCFDGKYPVDDDPASFLSFVDALCWENGSSDVISNVSYELDEDILKFIVFVTYIDDEEDCSEDGTFTMQFPFDVTRIEPVYDIETHESLVDKYHKLFLLAKNLLHENGIMRLMNKDLVEETLPFRTNFEKMKKTVMPTFIGLLNEKKTRIQELEDYETDSENDSEGIIEETMQNISEDDEMVQEQVKKTRKVPVPKKMKLSLPDQETSTSFGFL